MISHEFSLSPIQSQRYPTSQDLAPWKKLYVEGRVSQAQEIRFMPKTVSSLSTFIRLSWVACLPASQPARCPATVAKILSFLSLAPSLFRLPWAPRSSRMLGENLCPVGRRKKPWSSTAYAKRMKKYASVQIKKFASLMGWRTLGQISTFLLQ